MKGMNMKIDIHLDKGKQIYEICRKIFDDSQCYLGTLTKHKDDDVKTALVLDICSFEIMWYYVRSFLPESYKEEVPMIHHGPFEFQGILFIKALEIAGLIESRFSITPVIFPRCWTFTFPNKPEN